MQCIGQKKQFSSCFDELFILVLPPVNTTFSLKDLLCDGLKVHLLKLCSE